VLSEFEFNCILFRIKIFILLCKLIIKQLFTIVFDINLQLSNFFLDSFIVRLQTRNIFIDKINQILIYIILKKLYKLVEDNNLRNRVC